MEFNSPLYTPLDNIICKLDMKKNEKSNTEKFSEGECQRGQVCIKLRQCDDAVELLSEAETTFDDDRKNHIIDLLRDRVCGRRTDRTVCCAQESSSSGNHTG